MKNKLIISILIIIMFSIGLFIIIIPIFTFGSVLNDANTFYDFKNDSVLNDSMNHYDWNSCLNYSIVESFDNGTAINFTNSPDSYCCGNNEILSINDNDNITVSFWLKIINQADSITHNGILGFNTGYYIEYYNHTGYGIGHHDSGITQSYINFPMNSDLWNHWIFTVNSISNIMKIYKNGILINIKNDSNIILSTGNQYISLGEINAGSSSCPIPSIASYRSGNFIIDKLMTWNYSLSDNNSLFNETCTGDIGFLYNSYNYTNNQSEKNNCIPDWVCNGYENCTIYNNQSCNSVIDNNNCNISYNGSYSEFNSSVCNYCSYILVMINETECIDGYKTVYYNNTNFFSCCNITNISSDCPFNNTEQTGYINESCTTETIYNYGNISAPLLGFLSILIYLILLIFTLLFKDDVILIFTVLMAIAISMLLLKIGVPLFVIIIFIGFNAYLIYRMCEM